MGREGQLIEQPFNQPVNVSDWKGDDEFEIYPQGARDKSLLISPAQSEYDFLIPNHRYLFKHSFQHRSRSYPDQYWTEIIAYRIGCMLEVTVPPAFVAFDNTNNICGALIEWFLNYPDQTEERRVPGGDIMVNMIPGYDRKKGASHNFEIVARYLTLVDKKFKFESDWLIFWCDMFLFDAIIGNTDRHQDNWELLWNQDQDHRVRMSPVFDNGTSLGYEILESKMDNFFIPDRMRAYISKGKHHIRWQLNDDHQCQHIEMLLQLVKKYPLLKDRIKHKLDLLKMEQLRSIINDCILYPVTVPLSEKRAKFIHHLVEPRYLTISEQINLL
jgi:hypothetical protein